MKLKHLKNLIREELGKLKEQRPGRSMAPKPGRPDISMAPNPGRPNVSMASNPCPYEEGGTYDLGSDNTITLNAMEASKACQEWSQATDNGQNRLCWNLCEIIGCASFRHKCTSCSGCIYDPSYDDRKGDY